MDRVFGNGWMINAGRRGNVVSDNLGTPFFGAGSSRLGQFRERYPNVEFRGNAQGAHIDSSVRIVPGAIITLSPGLSITGDTRIGPAAQVRGGQIAHSQIEGIVNGGILHHSTVEVNGRVTGGQAQHSVIRGMLNGGVLHHCTLDRGGAVNGGVLHHCTLTAGATVNGGTFFHETIHGHAVARPNPDPFSSDLLGGGAPVIVNGSSSSRSFPNVTIDAHGAIHFGNVFFGHDFFEEDDLETLLDRVPSPIHPTPGSPPAFLFEPRMAAVHSPSSPSSPRSPQENRLHLPPPMPVEADESFDADPPDYMIDNLITYAPMHEVVMTPNGDTYDRRIIAHEIERTGRCPVTREPLALTDLRPNRALQALIDQWKAEHRIQRV